MIVDEHLANGAGAQCNDDLRPNETLDDYLTRVIAADNGVNPAEVTSEWISEQRKKMIYPNARFRTSSALGGKLHNGLKVLTRTEIDYMIRRGELSVQRRLEHEDD